MFGKEKIDDKRRVSTWKSQACRHTRHSGRHQVIEITVGGCCQLQCTEADVVQCFVVNAVGFVGVFDELVDTERCVVRFNNCVRYLG